MSHTGTIYYLKHSHNLSFCVDSKSEKQSNNLYFFHYPHQTLFVLSLFSLCFKDNSRTVQRDTSLFLKDTFHEAEIHWNILWLLCKRQKPNQSNKQKPQTNTILRKHTDWVTVIKQHQAIRPTHTGFKSWQHQGDNESSHSPQIEKRPSSSCKRTSLHSSY